MQLRVARRALEQALDQLVRLVLGERLEEDVGRVEHAAAPCRAAVEQLGARHAEQKDRRAA
jgi:hypothetical protein